MIGEKKLSTIRKQLRAAVAREGVNPLVSLDREIRRLQKNSRLTGKEPRSLRILRNALAELVEGKAPATPRPARLKRAKKAV